MTGWAFAVDHAFNFATRFTEILSFQIHKKLFFIFPAEGHHETTRLGLWVLTGLLSFLIVEKIFPSGDEEEEEEEEAEEEERNKVPIPNRKRCL